MNSDLTKWNTIKIRRYIEYKSINKKRVPQSVELKNKECISIEEWENRVLTQIDDNDHFHIFNTLKEYWKCNPNGDTAERSALISYANLSFNNPVFGGYDFCQKRGANLADLGNVYPWLGNSEPVSVNIDKLMNLVRKNKL